MTALICIIFVSVSIPTGRRLIVWNTHRRVIGKLTSQRVRGLPNAVLLLQVAIDAGMSPRAAIAAVGELPVEGGELGVVARDFAFVGHRLELGADLSLAIHSFDQERPSASLRRVLDVLRRAEVDGVGLVTHLEIVLHDLRRERSLALDAAAQRLTVSLLFPLVLCILPAFVLLAILPLLLGALSNLPG